MHRFDNNSASLFFFFFYPTILVLTISVINSKPTNIRHPNVQEAYNNEIGIQIYKICAKILRGL